MIRIDEQFHIESDTNQWTLVFQVEGDINPKTNKPKLTTSKWYCRSLEACLNRYKEESAKESETVDELMNKLDKINLSIKAVQTYLDF